MAIISLKVRVAEKGVVKTMQFDPHTNVYDACNMIRQKMPEAASLGNPKDYGLFLADDDPKKGVWMENGKSLEYYLVRAGDLLEYKKKVRTLKVRMLDGTVKTLLVDDSQPVGQLMIVICARIGITNHEEYALVREIPNERDWDKSQISLRSKEESKSLVNTLTLGRSKEKKMEQLRKQLHTDEELNWVDHSKTLREQGIEETETLLLRRKFFFSDQNIDARDPVQLNLLYVQCRDGVLDGTHPVARDEAFALAGLQCQIQFGDYVEAKHRSGFLDLREFLPKEYLKTKDAEKRILMEYRQLRGRSELDAKVEYVKRCRALKTYGVTFFVVKEKMKGKNKLVPRLLGINKDCVLRVDEKTKEILKVYPLEQVRRWAASPNTFTLDFGDYQDQYYSVQTTEGEKIAQLIAGYIDIILRKKKAKDHFGVEGDEGSTMLEDVVAPAKATLMSHGMITPGHAEEGNIAMPGILRPGANGELPYGTGSLTRAQYGAVGGHVTTTHVPPGQQPKIVDTTANRSQRALLGTIETSIRQVERAKEELVTKADLPPLGDDAASQKWKEKELDVQKQSVTDHLAAVGAATAQVVQLTGAVPERVDHTAVGAAISTISSNLPDMTKGVRTVAALMEDDDKGDQLLDATRRLCQAITDLLSSVHPERAEPEEEQKEHHIVLIEPPSPPPRRLKEPRNKVLTAAGHVGDYSHAVIQTMEAPTDNEKQFQDVLVDLAKQVATSTAQLVLKAKVVSGTCEEQPIHDRIIHAATQCAFATSQLVACARVVAPTIDSQACQEQLTDAAKQVMRAVEQLLKDAEMCKDKKAVGDLNEAARQVSIALNALLGHIKTGPGQARRTEGEEDLDTALSSADQLIIHTGPTKDMIRKAKVLAEATSHLVTQIRGEAQMHEDVDQRGQLMDAARDLADATTRMIEAARSCATSPDDTAHQMALKTAAEDVRAATSVAARDQLRQRAVQRLEQAAKQTAAAAAQTIAAAHASEASNRNVQSQEQLNIQCRDMAEVLPRVISAVKGSQAQPDDQLAQLELISVCQETLHPGGRLVSASRAAVPTVTDQASSTQLSNATKSLAEALAELRASLSKAQDACGAMEIDNAMEIVHRLDEELIEYRELYVQKRLYPVPGETPEGAATQLTTSTKAVGSSMAQLLSAAAQGGDQYASVSARDASEGLRQLTKAVHAVCATRPDAQGERLIDAARDVMDKSSRLFEEVKRCLQQPGHPDNQQRLAQVAKAVTVSLNTCVGCLPGQQDVDGAIRVATNLLTTMSVSQIPTSVRSQREAQEDLLRAASQLTDATNKLVATMGGPSHLISEAAHYYVQCLKRFINAGLEVAYHQQELIVREQIVEALRLVIEESLRLLTSVKASAADPNTPSTKQQLTAAAKAVTESINRLIDICTSGAQWQKECDNALRSIRAMHQLLDNPTEPVNYWTYFECLDVVTSQSKNLGEGMTGIAHHAKNSELDAFCHSVREVSNAVCRLAEAAAQSAYMVGVAEPSSIPGTMGIVDLNRFNQSVQAVRQTCDRISSGRMGRQEVLEAATTVAKHTSTLASMCRDASANSQNPAAKKHFINCAREVASSTAGLIHAIKLLDEDPSKENMRECALATQPLVAAVENLASFVASPEFASVPAKISSAGRDSQRPIIGAARDMLNGACELITTAKALALNPKDLPSWQQFSDHSKTVSESIKNLVATIMTKAPGKRECDAAIERIESIINLLNQTALQLSSSRQKTNEQGYLEQADNSARQILERIEGFREASKRSAENLGHQVNGIMSYFDPLADGVVGAVLNLSNSDRQMALLSRCKTVAESQLDALCAARDCGGNPKGIEFHATIDASCDELRVGLNELLQTIGEAVSAAGVVSTMVDQISKAIAKTDETLTIEGGSYSDYQTRMIHCCKEIRRIAQEMLSLSHTSVEELGPLALELSRNYSQLADDTRGAVATVSGADVAQRIKSSVQELGTGCIDLVKNAGACRANAGDQLAKRDLSDSTRVVTDKVALVLAALQAGARGTQACIHAASTVSGIIGDLDTTIMFATAGTLNPEREGEVFSDHRDAILKTAKALVEDTKALVAGAASSQEQLAVAAQNAVRTIVQLSDVVKSGAASLTPQNSEAQVLVINAVKDVAAALSNLIQATKNASGKSLNDPAMAYLKEAAKVMVTNVTSLLKTVKTVEDENQRGTRALEAAIEAIAQEIRNYDSSEPPHRAGVPDELFRVSRPITDATGKAMFAGNSCHQDDVIAAANMGRKVANDLLSTTKAVAYATENSEHRYRCLDAGRDVAIKIRELLQTLHMVIQRPTNETREMLIPASRAIAQAVTELVAFGAILKDSDWVDPSDLTVIAENELLSAANSIQAAADKLMALKPRPTPKEADSTLNFDQQILEAATSITNAVVALVKAASAAQRELVAQGRIDATPRHQGDDSQWSDGLISAARLVAAATQSLCEAANLLVQGQATEERLISAAKQVASSTAHLLVACKVKADMNSKAMQRLQAAGNAVKIATEHLVHAAKQAIDAEEARTLIISQRMVSGIAQVLSAQEEVLKKEKELNEARGRLAAIRREKYKRQPDHEGSPDAPYYSDF